MQLNTSYLDCAQRYVVSKVSYEAFGVADSEKTRYVIFSGKSQNVCIGFVDIVESTKTAARLHPSMLGMYYSIFLNSMAEIAQRFGAVVVKNMGDSVLFYFPMPVNQTVLQRVIECGFAMIESRCAINTKLFQERLPPISYRISLDYGTVSCAFSSSSSVEDIFGPPVNVCAKINHDAYPNGMVIGADLYHMIKHSTRYKFSQVCSFSSGLKNKYPVYTILQRFGKN